MNATALRTKTDALQNCGFVKTILMFCVILGHACAFWSGHWFTENPAIPSKGLNILYLWVNSFHIYAFALVSGYIFAYKVGGGGYDKYLPFLKTKVKRLLSPYLFVMAIWVAPVSAHFFQWDMPYLARKYILCVDPSQLWFLWMLFDVFAIIWPLRNVMMSEPIIGWLLSALFYGAGLVGWKLSPNVFCIWSACQYVPFFHLGMRIRVKETTEKNDITAVASWYGWIAADMFVFTCSTFVSEKVGVAWNLIRVCLNFTLHMTGTIMAWTTLQGLANCISWEGNKPFKILSSYSMPMYLFHQQIIYFTIVWLNGKVNPWLNAGVNFTAAVTGSFLISAILMRWKFTRALVGEK